MTFFDPTGRYRNITCDVISYRSSKEKIECVTRWASRVENTILREMRFFHVLSLEKLQCRMRLVASKWWCILMMVVDLKRSQVAPVAVSM